MKTHIHNHEETRTIYESKFDDLDVPAGITGTLVAFALMVLLGGLATAIVGTSIGFDVSNDNLGAGELIMGLIVVFFSFVGGGWAASRMARLAPVKNALMCVFWTAALLVLFATIGAVAGDQYDVIDFQNIPNWADQNDVTFGAIIGALVSVAVMFVGSAFGGMIGGSYNRQMDEELLIAEHEASDDDVRVIEPVEAVQTVHDQTGIPVPEPVYSDDPVRVEYTDDDGAKVVGADTEVDTESHERV